MRRRGPLTTALLVVGVVAGPRGLRAQEAGPTPERSIPGVPGVADLRAVVDFATVAQQEALAPARPSAPVVIHPPMPIPEGEPVAPAEGQPEARATVAEALLPLSPSPSASFLALADNNTVIPPDTHGAVGPNHLMVALNSQIRFQTRAGGTISTTSLDGFWSPVAGGSGVFDPKVVYDPFASRWIFTACDDDTSASSGVLIGVSQTPDPTGLWNLYKVDADAANTVWADFPSLGFNKDWIVVQVNMFTISTGSFSRSQIYVFNKADLYAGGAGLFTLIQLSGAGGTQSPALTYDNTLSTLYLLQNFSSAAGQLRLFTITGPIGSEVLTSIAFPTSPAPWSFSVPGGVDFAPQQGTARKIQVSDARMSNLVYRNGTLWAAQPILLPAGGAPTRASVQWWQIGTTGAVLQRGRVDDTAGNVFYSYPSIGVNARSDVLVGYSRFSASQFASANYSFRLGIDPANTLQADTVLKVGEASYDKDFGSGANRWGDYSATMVDPLNDVDLWTIQEYAALRVGGFDRWGTWWGRVSPPMPSLSINDVTVTEGLAGTVTASFTVSLSFATSATVMVDYATADGTATTADLDYVAAANTLTFAPGEVSKTVNVTVNGDPKFEADETFFVNLTNAANATLLDSQGQGTITNDDPLPAISIDDVPVVEGNAGTVDAVFTVSLSNPSSQTITVSYATQDGTATAPPDYVATGGLLTFPPGFLTEQLTVVVNGDTLDEGNETFLVDLSGALNATIADAQGRGTIVDDDAPSGNRVRFFTATSRSGENHLEWMNPDPPGPIYVSTQVVKKTGGFPANVSDGVTIFTGGTAGAKGSLTDTSVTDGTTYYYAAFVNLSDASVSAGRFVAGRPFDSGGAVRWAHSMGTTSLAPPGVGVGTVHAVANDNAIYSMQTGPSGGFWPSGWSPRAMNGPSQGRPSTVPVPVGGAGHVIFLGSQDGNVYAFDADTGAPVWTTAPPLGTMVQAAPSGIFAAFGSAFGITYSYILTGTRNTGSDNAFYALKLADGSVVSGWPFMGDAVLGRLGIITGQAAVDYATQRVYFTSYERGGAPDNRTVWCVDLLTGAALWGQAYGDIAAGPTLRGGRLYVGTNGGRVLALNASDGSLLWPFNTGDGPVKAFVTTNRFNNDLYFSTTQRVWKIEDTGSLIVRWATPSSGPGSVPSPSTPVLRLAGGDVWVGSGDGSLYRLNAASGGILSTYPLGDQSAAVGSPTVDTGQNFLYVGTEAGIVYAVQLP